MSRSSLSSICWNLCKHLSGDYRNSLPLYEAEVAARQSHTRQGQRKEGKSLIQGTVYRSVILFMRRTKIDREGLSITGKGIQRQWDQHDCEFVEGVGSTVQGN